MYDKLDLNKLAKQIADEIWISTEEKTIALQEYCEKKLKNIGTLSALEISDKLDELVEKVRNRINKKRKDAEDKRITPEWRFDNYSSDIIFKPQLLYENNIWKSRREILETIRKMGWRNFEFLCKHILEINKIANVGVTRKVKEEGIDFYGLLQMNKFSPGVLLMDTEIRIIGQAKRHSYVTGKSEVKEFLSSYNDVKIGRKEAIEKLPTWFVGLETPILGFLITTSKFTLGAEKYAKEKSIILKDGEQVIEDLIKSSYTREWFSRKNRKLTFNKTLFMKFFKNNA